MKVVKYNITYPSYDVPVESKVSIVGTLHDKIQGETICHVDMEVRSFSGAEFRTEYQVAALLHAIVGALLKQDG